MKRMHAFQKIMLAVSLFLLAACKNGSDPIYLVNVTHHTQVIDGKIELSSFNPGEKYLIRGGEGNYTIRNANEKVIDYRYDGDTLTLIPVSIGEAHTLIADRSGNSCALSISVKNPENHYLTDSLSGEVEGDALTKGEEAELKARITQDSPVQPGGGFLFTYTDASLSYGEIKLFPGPTGIYQIGLFERSLKYTEETGEPYQQIKAEMAGSTRLQYTFMLIEKETPSSGNTNGETSHTENTTTVSLIKEDVTDQYKGEFIGLTKAYRIYHLTKQ